jgi:hypothetical protein
MHVQKVDAQMALSAASAVHTTLKVMRNKQPNRRDGHHGPT